MTARPGHEAAVTSVGLAPDGNTVVSASFDESVVLWQVKTGKELLRIPNHPKVCSAAFGPRGETVFTAGWDGTVRIWRTANGRLLHRIPVSAERVMGFAISPNGNLFASGDSDGKLSLWQTATGRKVGHIDTAFLLGTLEFCPKRNLLGCARCVDDAVHVYAAETGQRLFKLAVYGTPIYSFTFSTDGRSLVSGDRDGSLALWELATGQERLKLSGPASIARCVAMSADQRMIFSGHDDGTVCGWDAVTGDRRFHLPAHRGKVRSLAISSNGKLLASGSEDMTLLVLDLSQMCDQPGEAKSIGPQALEELWEDLASDDGREAYRAVVRLVAAPTHAIPFLRGRGQTLAQVQERVAALIAKLDHQNFRARDRAMHQLRAFGRLAERALEDNLRPTRSPEVRRRVELLLAELGAANRSFVCGKLARPIRMVEILEQIGTPAATEALVTLAEKTQEIDLELEAQAALARLKMRDGESFDAVGGKSGRNGHTAIGKRNTR